MAIFPWQQLPVNKSPFVTVFQMVGIKWAAGLINLLYWQLLHLPEFYLYSTGRHLYQIAKKKRQTVKWWIVWSWIAYLVWGFQVFDYFSADCGCCFCLYQCVARCLRCLLPWLRHLLLVSTLLFTFWPCLPILGTVNRKNLCQMVFCHVAYKVLNPLTIVSSFYLFVSFCKNQHWSDWATIWIILFGIYSNWKHSK